LTFRLVFRPRYVFSEGSCTNNTTTGCVGPMFDHNCPSAAQAGSSPTQQIVCKPRRDGRRRDFLRHKQGAATPQWSCVDVPSGRPSRPVGVDEHDQTRTDHSVQQRRTRSRRVRARVDRSQRAAPCQAVRRAAACSADVELPISSSVSRICLISRQPRATSHLRITRG
jgi:hypothetical protein